MKNLDEFNSIKQHLYSDEVSETVNTDVVGQAEQEGEDTTEDHPPGQIEPQVHPLRHNAGPEHEEGVREEVGGVQETQVGLGLFLRLAVDLSDPGLTSARVVGMMLAVQEGFAVLHDGYRLPGEMVGGVGEEGEDEDRCSVHKLPPSD